MTIRFILRPASIFTTPLALKEALNARLTVRIPNRRTGRTFDWHRDFFIGYPDESTNAIHNKPDRYRFLRRLYQSTKPEQRKILSESFPVPNTYYRGGWFGIPSSSQSTRLHPSFVLRPLRHMGGQGWELLGSPSKEGIERLCTGENYYVQELFPKRWEYRVVFCKGEILYTLIKRNTSELHHSQPWNHTNGTFFTTVHTWSNNRLRHTDLFDRFNECDWLKTMHFGALDILLDEDKNYVITEVNFAPAVTIRNNMEKIVSHVENTGS